MDPLGFLGRNPDRLTSFLEQHRQEIYDSWLAAVRQKWAGQAAKLSLLEQKLADREDLFSMLRACSGKTEAFCQRLASLVNLDLITSQEYSILDVGDEIMLLKDSILHLLHKLELSGDDREQLNFLLQEQLFALVQALLGGTRELLTSLVNGGMRGYCQVDEKGRIIFADREVQRLLNREPTPGEPLDQLFVEDDRDSVTEVISGQAKTLPGQLLFLDSHRHGPIPVGTEICPLVMEGRRRGWYACLVDLSAIQKKELDLYENLPVGLARVDREGTFRYANRKFLEILGLQNHEWQDKALWDFLRDENRAKVENELKRRREGLGGEYEVTFTRESGYQVPVKIYAVPERDLKGRIIGSLAIVRSLEQDQAIAQMHKYMATVDRWQDMLIQVIREVKPFVPYDLCSVSEISSDQKHLRRLLAEPPLQNAMSKIGRWEMPDKMTQWLKEQQEIYFDDIEAFLSRPGFEEARENPVIQNVLQQGYHFFIRLPIIQDQPIASLTFMSKASAYDESHREMLKSLPLDKAVRLALSRHKEEESNFLFELTQKISTEEKEFRKVAKNLVEELGEHYGWGNVALFRADEGLNRFLLLDQKNRPGTSPIPEGYEQPLEKGVLGYVYRTGTPVNLGNVKEDPRFKDIYISPWQAPGHAPQEEVNSELCLRLATENACFLLNIEDPKFNAFSEEEVKALQFFWEQAKTILESSWLHHTLKAALQSTSDAIINTDRKGRITRFNRAAAQLLGYTEEEMREKTRKGFPLKGFFQDARVAAKAITERYFPSQEVTWVNKAKEPVNVLLSASALPDELGGKIFTAKNLAERDRAEQLEHLGKLYQDIALQMKTPLSLAFAWLKRLVQKGPQPGDVETLDKVMKQLRKVDLTFDRLSLYDYDEEQGWFPTQKLLLGFDEVWGQVKNDLPESDWHRIAYAPAQPLPTLWGDLFQLIFCVETILSHLLGVIPEDEKILVKVSSSDDWTVMEFSGVYPEIRDSQTSRALVAAALGENVIKRFMAKHQGEYFTERKGNRMIFRLTVPAAKGEQP